MPPVAGQPASLEAYRLHVASRPKQPPRDIYVSCNVLRGISPDREPILNKRSRIVRGASRSSDVVKHRLTVLEQTSGSEQMCRDEDVVRISISSLDFTGAVAVICVQPKKTHESLVLGRPSGASIGISNSTNGRANPFRMLPAIIRCGIFVCAHVRRDRRYA